MRHAFTTVQEGLRIICKVMRKIKSKHVFIVFDHIRACLNAKSVSSSDPKVITNHNHITHPYHNTRWEHNRTRCRDDRKKTRGFYLDQSIQQSYQYRIIVATSTTCGCTPSHHHFYSLIHIGGEGMEKLSIKLNFRQYDNLKLGFCWYLVLLKTHL